MQIMSWEFCSRRHDEYITRRFLTPQVEFLDRHAFPVLHIWKFCSFFNVSTSQFIFYVASTNGQYSTSLPNYNTESVAMCDRL
jgi:hypothetical protein